MKLILLLITLIVNVSVYANCDEVISLLSSDHIDKAFREYQLNCKGKDFYIIDEFGDKVIYREKDHLLTQFFNQYSKCEKAYSEKDYPTVEACLGKHEMDYVTESLDKNFKTSFAQKVQLWKTYYKQETAKNKAGEEKAAIAKIEKEKMMKNEKETIEANRKKKGIDLYQNACGVQGTINHFMNKIEKENEAGRISGVVDKAVLHDAGKRIQIFKELMAGYDEEHKKRFGIPLDIKKCKCDRGALGIDCK